ncbi:MAG: hypothetical protein ACRECV_04995 [Xanthobacteraceae bacterium]
MSEMIGLGGACALILSFPYAKTQVGLAAVMIVLLLVTQRAVSIPVHPISAGDKADIALQ